MRKFLGNLGLLWAMQSAFAGTSCEYGKTPSCASNEFCVRVDTGKSECRKFPPELPLIAFPFAAGLSVLCDQGSLSPPANSHTWLNTAFALDLQGDRKQENLPVFASAAGRVIVFNDCQTENDRCGLGFGNSVKILRDDGYLVFYAHLKKALVKTGDLVKVGDQIGIEGMTGATGTNNRHLHFSVHYDWRPSGYEHWKQTGYLPDSRPFKMNLCKSCEANCRNSPIDIRQLKCRRVFPEAKAICAGRGN